MDFFWWDLTDWQPVTLPIWFYINMDLSNCNQRNLLYIYRLTTWYDTCIYIPPPKTKHRTTHFPITGPTYLQLYIWANTFFTQPPVPSLSIVSVFRKLTPKISPVTIWVGALSRKKQNIYKYLNLLHVSLGGGFKDFIFSPLPGEDSHFD